MYLEQVITYLPPKGGFNCPPACDAVDVPIRNLGKKIIDLDKKRTFLMDFDKSNIELLPQSVNSFVFSFNFKTKTPAPAGKVHPSLVGPAAVEWDRFNIVILINSPSYPNQLKLTQNIKDI